MDDFDDEDPPLYQGIGSVYDLHGKPKRGKQPKVFGFVHFPDKPVPKKQPKPVAKKPQRRARKR